MQKMATRLNNQRLRADDATKIRYDCAMSLRSHILLIFLIICHLCTSSTTSSFKFRRVASPSGSALCAVSDQLHHVQKLNNARMTNMRCSVECAKSPTCLLYQFTTDSALCELFMANPTQFDIIPNCKAFFTLPGECIIHTPKTAPTAVICILERIVLK